MRTTITIRADRTLRSLLEARAAADGRSLSDVVREILERGLAQRPIGERAGHLRGRLTLPRRFEEPWRTRLRGRNWRP